MYLEPANGGVHREVESCLVCGLGRVRLGLPASSVDRVIEYSALHRLPLATTNALSLGLWEGRAVLSVGLDPPRAGAGPRAAKGVLLSVGAGAVPWAVEVDWVASFVVPEAIVGGPDGASAGLPPWVERMRDPRDKQAIAAIDVRGMLAAFGAFGAPSAAGSAT